MGGPVIRIGVVIIKAAELDILWNVRLWVMFPLVKMSDGPS